MTSMRVPLGNEHSLNDDMLTLRLKKSLSRLLQFYNRHFFLFSLRLLAFGSGSASRKLVLFILFRIV